MLTSRVIDTSTSPEELVEKLIKVSEKSHEQLETAAKNPECSKMRQPRNSGLEMDIVQALHDYGVAESAFLLEEDIAIMIKNLKNRRGITDYHYLYEEYCRTCELEVLLFYFDTVERIRHLHQGMDKSQDGDLTLLRGFRAAIKAKDLNVMLRDIPPALDGLYELAVPVVRGKTPVTTEELTKEKQMLAGFDSRGREIKEEDAEVKWKQLQVHIPMLKKIENVQIAEELYFKSHPSIKWLVKIIKHDQHARNACHVEATIQEDLNHFNIHPEICKHFGKRRNTHDTAARKG